MGCCVPVLPARVHCTCCRQLQEPVTASMMMSSGVTVVMGGQWGDEGKGKLVDVLAVEADFVCRCQVCVSIDSIVWVYTVHAVAQRLVIYMYIYI